VRTARPVGTVILVPEGEPLAFEDAGGRVAFTVPEVRGHRMVELRFE
jgi:hypothetical protein